MSPLLLTTLLSALLALAAARPRPQDASTNNIVPEAMSEKDGESLVASLILAVARDWDLGMEDATEFVRAVPAATMNGTTFGPTTHPIDQAGRISFSARSEQRDGRGGASAALR